MAKPQPQMMISKTTGRPIDMGKFKDPGKVQVVEKPITVIEVIAFAAFLFWGVAALTFASQHVPPSAILKWNLPDWLRDPAAACMPYADRILILLAFFCTHLHAARQWSDGIARRWCFIVLLLAYLVEAYGVRTGAPFGPYKYTDNFGPMIPKMPLLGTVPLIIPFAWHVVLTNSLFVVRMIAPRIGRTFEALFVGVLAATYDFVLEPFAINNHYWIWTEGEVPPLNYAAWFLVTALIVRFLAPTVSTLYKLDPRPVFILGITMMIFVLGDI